MVREEDIQRLMRMSGCGDEIVIADFLEDAEEYVLSYTNRRKLPTELYKAVRDLALIAYNRRGTEGESARSEGGESYSFDNMPKQIYDVLNRYRLARIGGKTYEAETKQG